MLLFQSPSNNNLKHEVKKKEFLPTPEFQGGPKALSAFISQNIIYPQDAITKKIEGTVVVKAEISHKGDVIDTKVISGIGSGCNEEAVRVVKLLKFKIGKVRNIKISFFKTFNIHFKLPIQQINPPPSSINYIYVETAKINELPINEKPKTVPYSIVISSKG